MKLRPTELHLHRKDNTSIILLLLLPSFLFFTFVPLPFTRTSHHSSSSSINITSNTASESTETSQRCDIFSGQWVPYPKGPYYNNETCNSMIDQQNCLKFGRPDREYLQWRWKPDDCELPLFDAAEFLKLVRGKSMAFVGDSVGKNQMESLLCLLSGVSNPKDISMEYTSDPAYFKRWFYTDYSFTLASLWSPFLVTARDAAHALHSYDNLMNLYLDHPDESWVNDIKTFDYVIISGGQWFFRPLLYHEDGQTVGCHVCNIPNITEKTSHYGYRKAFRTAFRTVLDLEGYKGVTILRTFSPAHFEGGEWNRGGRCERTTPFGREEKRVEGYVMEAYLTQVEEFRKAETEGREKGLRFWMMDTTEMMMLRPDGHPNKYGHSVDANVTLNDCVHWCLPGPVDTWNEILMYTLRMVSQGSSNSTL